MCQEEEALHPPLRVRASGDHATTGAVVPRGTTHAACRELEVGVAVEEHVLTLLLRRPDRSTRRRALAALVGGHRWWVPSGVHAPLRDGGEVGPVRLGAGAPSASAALLALVLVHHVLAVGLQRRRLQLLRGRISEAWVDVFVVIAVRRGRDG